jgi:hypothetical protein
MPDFDRQRCPSSPCRALLPVNGAKKDGRNDGACLATLTMSEIIDESALLPVHGEKMPAGR